MLLPLAIISRLDFVSHDGEGIELVYRRTSMKAGGMHAWMAPVNLLDV